MEKKRDLENQIQRRSQVADFTVGETERTIEFPFSSEEPVNRGYLGNEILDHSREDSIDFSRLNSSAPLLLNHDTSKVIGVVERAWLDKEKKQGRAQVRFANNALGKETLEMVNDKIYRNVSFGYSVDESEEIDKDSYRVTKFQPAEISLVSVPADFSIGLGRAKEAEEKIDNNIAMPAKQESSNMQAQRINDVQKAASVASQTQTLPKEKMTDTPDLSVVRSEERKAERARTKEITALFREHEMGEQALEDVLDNPKADINYARALVCDKIKQKPVETIAQIELNPEKDKVRYSLSAAMQAVNTGDWSSREAGFAREISQEVERTGVKRTSERSFLVPYTEIFKTRASYNTGAAGTGGNLVATDLLQDEFVYAFDNAVKAVGMGVQVLPGLVGDVAIPRQSSKSTVYWLANETTAITQSESQFDQLTLQPKNAAVLSKYTRQTLLQATPGIDEFIRKDLSDRIAVGVDAGIINGSGSSGQMTGVLNQSGIGNVAMGTNGAALTLEALISLEKEVLIDNAAGDRMGYLVNAKTLADLKSLRAGGSASGDGAFLWNVDPSGIGRGGTPGVINGYPIEVTNNVPSNLTKGSSSGVCSAVVFGNWESGLLGVWGTGLEIEMGLESDDFAKALQSVRAITTVDFGVRSASAFSAILDVTH